VIYTARFGVMSELVALFTENCCQGSPLAGCRPAVVCEPQAPRARRSVRVRH
jgi:hypothetical protein